MNPTSLACPLCIATSVRLFFQDTRDYYRCGKCQLVFVPPEQFLSAEQEKEVYDQHQNSPGNEGYRKFLSRLFEPLNDRLAPGSRGLDFGSGPGPTLSLMFEEAGHKVSIYDPFYAPDGPFYAPNGAPSAVAGTDVGENTRKAGPYDFITASEVVEHLHRPEAELNRLWNCLRPGGLLGIMTKRVIDQDAFAHWHYKNDPTHVCFFSEETFEHLATRWQAKLTIVGDDVVLLAKRR